MTAALAALRAAAGRVAAEGTDPDALAAIVAWSVQPRRHPDALRRRFRDDRRDDRLFGSTPLVPVAVELARMVGPPSASDASVAERLVDAWRAVDVRVALVGDPAYPAKLAEGWPNLDPPVWLAWRGEPPTNGPGVAVVGARRATSYGTGISAWLAEAVADAGARVISGGALGVDAAAHEAAHDRPGGTTVVLGCGHQVAYPRPHAGPGGLFARVLEQGGSLVSEALPHEPPRAHQIRSRNRIVAALADAVVVVEGGARSGALLTAGAAAERGRTVLAVPGDVRAPGSAAPHRLLAEGAAPCGSPAELLEVIDTSTARTAGASGSAPSDERPAATTTLSSEVHAVLAEAWPRALRLEDLARRAGQPVASLLAALTRARVNGEVAEGTDGIRLRRAPDRPS